MSHRRLSLVGCIASSLLAAGLASGGPEAQDLPHRDVVQEGRKTIRLSSDAPPVRAFERDGRILSLYGRPMASGGTPKASAEQFITENIDVFGLTAEELREGVDYGDGAFTKGLMYDRDAGEYRFILHRYSQVHGDLPVFRSELKLLVRNAPGHEMVLANANLRDLGDFQAPADARIDRDALQRFLDGELGGGTQFFTEPRLIVWAGMDTGIDVPTLAVEFIAERGQFPDIENYDKVLYVINHATGRVIYREDQVLNVDVEGNVSGNSTDGYTSDPCSTQSFQPIPYARVNIGGNVEFADENGDFVIPNAGSDPVTVQSRIWGPWFHVFNFGGADALLEQTVTPPGPANFVHNQSQSEFTTAEVNAYRESQRIRDLVLQYDPDFPIFASSDQPFRVHVNSTGSCNAFYQGTNTLFLRAGGNCPNTAYSSIVYHEYGHHLVARATGSQCQWGEGNSDVAAVVVSDEPELAFGFFGQCDEPLRNAENDCQYESSGCSSCGGPCHNCGQLISGCFWDLRNNLLVTDPDDYRTISGQLWLASLFLHNTGTEITPADTINYLTADDDDGNLENGTPHYFQIANAFTDHNMVPPPLIFLTFELPNGAPEFVAPGGGDTIELTVNSGISDPKPDSGVLYFDDGSGNMVEVPMTETSTDRYEGTFPSALCGNIVNYFFSVDTVDDITVFYPVTAPRDRFESRAAFGLDVVLDDDFETDTGWTVSGDATRGEWNRGVPVECNLGDPPTDGDGSGQCYLTGNDPDTCFTAVARTTILTSPVLDATAPEIKVAYYRWYDNSLFPQGRDDPFVVEVSDDAGANWTEMDRVEPESEEAEGGWYFREFRVANFVTNTDQFQIRFIAQDVGGVSKVEAAVDGVKLIDIICGCVEDLDGSGSVDFGDVLDILAAWGNAGGPEDLDGSGTVDFGDILEVLAAWGPCV